MELTVNNILANQFALCKVLWLRWQKALSELNTLSLSSSSARTIVCAGRRKRDGAVEKVSDEQLMRGRGGVLWVGSEGYWGGMVNRGVTLQGDGWRIERKSERK